MTQVFDQETGSVDAVTVIEAGPLPGRHRCGPKRPTATTPSSSRSSRSPTGSSRRASSAISRKAGVGAAPASGRVPRLERAQPSARLSWLSPSSPETRSRSSGVSMGKGFQGTIKRHNFGRGPVSPRLPTSGSLARWARRRRPRACSRARRWPAGWARERVTQPGLVVDEIHPERNLLLVKSAVPGPKNGFVEVREDQLMAAPNAT